MISFRNIPIDDVFKRIAEGDEELKKHFMQYIASLDYVAKMKTITPEDEFNNFMKQITRKTLLQRIMGIFKWNWN